MSSSYFWLTHSKESDKSLIAVWACCCALASWYIPSSEHGSLYSAKSCWCLATFFWFYDNVVSGLNIRGYLCLYPIISHEKKVDNIFYIWRRQHKTWRNCVSFDCCARNFWTAASKVASCAHCIVTGSKKEARSCSAWASSCFKSLYVLYCREYW